MRYIARMPRIVFIIRYGDMMEALMRATKSDACTITVWRRL